MDLSRQQSLKRFLFGADPRRTGIRLGVIIICLTLIASFIRPVRIEGAKLGFGFTNSFSKNFQSDDLISLKLAGKSVVALAKVIALPGETVQIESGKVLVNGIIRPYNFPSSMQYPKARNQVSEYFVAIYERNSKAISDCGRVDTSRIIGKVFFL